MGRYDDIINLKRPVSKRTQMTLEQRSAQFAPFSALTGYEGQVKETARITNAKIEIDEELKSVLNFQLQIIQEKVSNKPKISIKYFVPDLRKDGGAYNTITGYVRKIDEYKKVIILENNIEIPISEIVEITSNIF